MPGACGRQADPPKQRAGLRAGPLTGKRNKLSVEGRLGLTAVDGREPVSCLSLRLRHETRPKTRPKTKDQTTRPKTRPKTKPPDQRPNQRPDQRPDHEQTKDRPDQTRPNRPEQTRPDRPDQDLIYYYYYYYYYCCYDIARLRLRLRLTSPVEDVV